MPLLDSAFATIIPVGAGPTDALLVESRNLLFVVNQLSNNVSIIDITTETVINTITLGTNPAIAAYVPATSLLYVTNQGSDNVSVVDMTNPLSAFITATITVGTTPFTIDFNSVNNQLYVTNCFDSNVSIIDADSMSGTFNTVVNTVTTGVCPVGLNVNESTNKIYVGNLFGNDVAVINGADDTLVSTVPAIGAGRIGIDESNNHIFASNTTGDSIVVINGADDTVLQTITVGNGPRAIVYNPDTDQILVANNIDGTISIIDGTSFDVLGAIPVGSGPAGMSVSTTNVIYVGLQNDNAVNAFTLGTNLPPVANSGVDQIVNEGDVVQLDGTASSDIDGDPLSFQWTQTQGPTITLSDSTISQPTFTAPDIDENILFEFQLVVNDGEFSSLPDLVNVIVRDVTIFSVPLNSVGDQLEGNLTLDDFPANTPLVFDFVTSLEEPETVPVLNNPALYYDIDNSVIDFSDSGNFPSNNPPVAQFLVDRKYSTEDSFSDNFPVVSTILLDEVTSNWDVQGNPNIPNTNKFYLVDSINDKVIVIDGNTHETITSIAVGDNPVDSIFEPTLNKLYITNAGSETVSVINTLTNTVQSTIPVVGAISLNIDTATNKLYVPNSGPGTITVIDTLTDTIVDTISTSGTTLNGIVVNSALQRLYTVDITDPSVFVIDTVTKTEINVTPLEGIPTGLVINPDNNSVYIATFTTNAVTVFDGNTNTIIKTIPVGSLPVGVKINSLTDKVFVANAGTGTVSVIDTITNLEIDTVNLTPGILNVAVNENTDRVYVVNQAVGTLSIIDGSKTELLGSIPLTPGAIFDVVLNPAVSNPVRDPSNDNRDIKTKEILECAYIAKLPHLSKFAIGGCHFFICCSFVGWKY